MEKQSTPRNEGLTSKLKLFLFCSRGTSLDPRAIFEKTSKTTQDYFELVKSSQESDIVIKLQDETITLINDDNRIDQQNLTLFHTTSNLENLLSLYMKQEFEKNNFRGERTTKIKTRARNLIGYLNKNQHNNKKAKKVFLQTSQREELLSIYSQLDTIENLPRSLSRLSYLQDYQGIQIIIHEKGQLSAQSYSLDLNEKIKHQNISAQKFNSIFSLIKKSKHRLFDQSQILRNEIGVIGTFLAKEFELKKHSIIFIISRNDFLPPTQAEFDSFMELNKDLSPVFEYLLLREHLTIKNHKINFALHHYPEALAIVTQSDHILFKNKFFDFEMLEEFNQNFDNFFVINLSQEHKLIIKVLDDKNLGYDIFHFQRISLLGELLNTLQHELSNPLFGLKLASEVFPTEKLEQETQETIKDVSQNITRCETIIKNFSMLYTDQAHDEPISLGQLIEETIVLTKSETRDIKKYIQYEPKEVENIQIHINRTWFTQILFNLLINSAQAIKSKDVCREDYIQLTITHNSEQNKFIINVKDSGPGITKDLAPKLFEPFYTSKSTGTGLGLSICRSLAQRMGADVYFDENFSDGASFKFELSNNSSYFS